MSDLIRVVDLEVFAHIGVPEEERRETQRLLISLELSVDSFSHAAGTDNVAWTMNYADVVAAGEDSRGPARAQAAGDAGGGNRDRCAQRLPDQKIGLEIKKFVSA